MDRLFSQGHDHIPILDLGKRCGSTDYIDFIKTAEVKYPIVKGIDCYKRPFIVMKVISVDDGSLYMETFFQRYTDDTHLWMGAGHHYQFMDTYGGMTEKQFQLLKRLIEGQTCDLPQKISSDHQPKKIRLCTQEEVAF
jgi:hypothetical protein